MDHFIHLFIFNLFKIAQTLLIKYNMFGSFIFTKKILTIYKNKIKFQYKYFETNFPPQCTIQNLPQNNLIPYEKF